MSVFSVTAIDRLVEPAPATSSSRSSSMERESLSSAERRPPFSFYPPLYVTPPQQRPASPSSFSPSPYVLNFKRRCPVQNGHVGAGAGVESETIVASQNRSHKILPEDENSGSTDEKNGFISAGSRSSEDKAAEMSIQQVEGIETMAGDRGENSHLSGVSTVGDSGHGRSTPRDKRLGKEANGDYRSDGSHPACSTASRSSEEFFDAPDSPFDDSATDDQAGLQNTTARSPIMLSEKITPRLQEEIARRIRAEEALASLQLQWAEMARRCTLNGLSVSSGPCEGGPSGEGEASFLEPFSEKLSIARLVAGAIASAAVRAVKEEELESIVITKNREISRLWDKLQYYELVNHEMSQRNQEAIEIAQRRRKRRHRRQKWALGCFCAAFCMGTTGLLSYKFFPWEQARTWTKSLICQVEPNSTELASI